MELPGFFGRKDENYLYKVIRYAYKHRLTDNLDCHRNWSSFLSWPAFKFEDSFQE